MRIGIVCYPTFGGSGVLATELGKALAQKGHQVHFITYQQPLPPISNLTSRAGGEEIKLVRPFLLSIP